MGALTCTPRQALVCPRRNAFGTPSAGVLQAVSFFQNYQFCLGQQPKPQIVLIFRLLHAFLTDSPALRRCLGHGKTFSEKTSPGRCVSNHPPNRRDQTCLPPFRAGLGSAPLVCSSRRAKMPPPPRDRTAPPPRFAHAIAPFRQPGFVPSFF